MELRTKLLLGLGATLLLSTPLLVLASCSDQIDKSNINKAMKNVRENMLIKNIASWKMPSEVSDEILEQELLNMVLITPYANYGYTPSFKVIKGDDIKGTLEIEATLTQGKETKTERILLNGFLTTEQAKNNEALQTELGTLPFDENTKGFLITTVKPDLVDKSLSVNLEKNINELIDISTATEVGKKLNDLGNSLKGFNKKGKAIEVIGVQAGGIEQELWIEKKW